jgi:4-amino-4-deoxy-L-arabinose transferase-like glycosyltransferase
MKRLNAFLDNWPRTLLVIFIGALLVRLAFISFLQDGFYFPDSLSYTRAAGKLLDSGEFGDTYHRAPAYPVFLATIQVVFGNNIFAIRVIESVIGALVAVVIAALGKRTGGAGVGALAGALWAVYPMGIFIVGLVYPTGLTAVLLACGACCILPYSDEDLSAKRVFAAGLILGLAALTVPIAVATIGFLSFWLIYWARDKRFLLVGLFCLGAAVTILPWTVRNYSVHRQLVLIDARLGIVLPRIGDVASDEADDRVEAILQRPELFAVHFAKEFFYFWRLYPEQLGMTRPKAQERYYPDPRLIKDTMFSSGALTSVISVASTVPLFLFAAIGTVAMWLCKERRRDLSLLWTMILSFAIGYSLFFTKMRYRVPIEPYLMILGAYGLAQTWNLRRRSLLQRAFPQPAAEG